MFFDGLTLIIAFLKNYGSFYFIKWILKIFFVLGTTFSGVSGKVDLEWPLDLSAEWFIYFLFFKAFLINISLNEFDFFNGFLGNMDLKEVGLKVYIASFIQSYFSSTFFWRGIGYSLIFLLLSILGYLPWLSILANLLELSLLWHLSLLRHLSEFSQFYNVFRYFKLESLFVEILFFIFCRLNFLLEVLDVFFITTLIRFQNTSSEFVNTDFLNNLGLSARLFSLFNLGLSLF